MNKIINGKLYDTETVKEVGHYDNDYIVNMIIEKEREEKAC